MIYGPSHCVRLEYLFSTGQLIRPRDTYIDGQGGRPIWDPLLVNDILNNIENNLLIFVPDFRFGNGTDFSNVSPEILDLNDDLFLIELSKLKKVNTGIVKEKISKDLDLLLYNLSLRVLDIFMSIIPNLSLVFWCLTIRERDNFSSSKYVVNGIYKHPIWNLADLLNRYSRKSIDTSTIVRNKLKYLHIDSSAHPSIIGSLAILRSFFKKIEFNLSIKFCFNEFKKLTSSLVEEVINKDKKIIVVADNRFSKVFLNFSRKGIFPKIPNVIFFTPENFLKENLNGEFELTDFDFIIFQDRFLSSSNFSPSCSPDSLPIFYSFPYNEVSKRIIKEREERTRNNSFIDNEKFSIHSLCEFNYEFPIPKFNFKFSFLELNDTAFPTLEFVLNFFSFFSEVASNTFDSKYNYFLRNLRTIYD